MNRTATIFAALLATSPAWADAGSPRVYGMIYEMDPAVWTGTCTAELPCEVVLTISEGGMICGPARMTITAGSTDQYLIASLSPKECIR